MFDRLESLVKTLEHVSLADLALAAARANLKVGRKKIANEEFAKVEKYQELAIRELAYLLLQFGGLRNR